MYQMATITYHTLHSTQTVILKEPVEYKGQTTIRPVSTSSTVDGRYWTDFDRPNPIEGPARDKAWTGTAHALIANLGVGTVTASALQLGLGTRRPVRRCGLRADPDRARPGLGDASRHRAVDQAGRASGADPRMTDF